jgi:hypothetical protein
LEEPGAEFFSSQRHQTRKKKQPRPQGLLFLINRGIAAEGLEKGAPKQGKTRGLSVAVKKICACNYYNNYGSFLKFSKIILRFDK